jgi:uncharacterized membrane protein YeaQ/YmgE (transglycosylase-associated protein family)
VADASQHGLSLGNSRDQRGTATRLSAVGALRANARPRDCRKGRPVGIILWLIIGAIAGWLAGLMMRGGGFGVLGNIVVGIVGALIGGWLFGILGMGPADNIIGSLVTAVVGACVLLFIVGLVKRA